MVKRKSKYVWAIAYIDKDHMFRVEADLIKAGLKEIEAYIPTIRVLSKRFKNHPVYANVPLMMNYGFIKVKKKKLKDPGYMASILECSPCLIGWLKDLANSAKSKLRKNQDDSLAIAYTEKPFITRLGELQKINDIYSPHELKKLAKNETVTLKCYPFEGMHARVLGIDMDKRKVRVELLDNVGTGFFSGKMDLDFEHVFFTIYKSETDENLSGLPYLEDLKSQNKNHKVFKDEDSEK